MGCKCCKKQKRDLIEELVEKNKIVLFSRATCPYSLDAKRILNELGVDYITVGLDQCPNGNEIAQQLVQKTGLKTIPQVFINGKFIGGACDLAKLRLTKQLARMTGGQLPCHDRYARNPPPCCNKPYYKHRKTIKVDEVTRIIRSYKIVMISKSNCPFSDDAKELLDRQGISYGLVELDKCTRGHELAKKLESRFHYNAVPLIFIGGKFIGGLCDLQNLQSSGALKSMVENVRYCLKAKRSPYSRCE